jgi:hypothetical protein
MRVFDHPTLLARICVLAIAAVGALAVAAISVNDAGAASSGGIGTPGSDTGTAEEPATEDGDKYTRLWEQTSERNKRWAGKTAKCESGKDPKAIGGGGLYRGAFQFMKSTWKSAPKSPGGDPIDYNYKTQAVVAIALKKRDGAGHWPNCG